VFQKYGWFLPTDYAKPGPFINKFEPNITNSRHQFFKNKTGRSYNFHKILDFRINFISVYQPIKLLSIFKVNNSFKLKT